MDIFAKIKELKYTPYLCKELDVFNIKEIEMALSTDATFILKIDDKNQLATSWWVSPKRTRSYPYARVYDSLNYSGKKVTIIPIFKDEGLDGDRDFLQWDTISLMSLLDVYVIIAYYIDASPNSNYQNKITNQRFDSNYICEQINDLLSYKSSALHWNVSQTNKVAQISNKALESYDNISHKLGVEMHSRTSAENRIKKLKLGKDVFMKLSRGLAESAQNRESVTIQPKENLNGVKGKITITNYLGGKYYFTSDEVELHGNDIYLIDAKHTKTANIPSIGDIKDGLLKMTLFTNLEDVCLNETKYNPVAILKLTTGESFNVNDLKKSQKETLDRLKKEARQNDFRILLNETYLDKI